MTPKRYFAVIVLNGAIITLQVSSEQEEVFCTQGWEGVFPGNSFAWEFSLKSYGTESSKSIKESKILENILLLRIK